MQRQLVEEVAEDLEDGIITRPEALQRLGPMGIIRCRRDGPAGFLRRERTQGPPIPARALPGRRQP